MCFAICRKAISLTGCKITHWVICGKRIWFGWKKANLFQVEALEQTGLSLGGRPYRKPIHQRHLDSCLCPEGNTFDSYNSYYSESACRSGFQGGITKYSHFKRDVKKLLSDRKAIVTTLIDFCRLPQDFPGMQDLPLGPSRVQVSHVQKAIWKDLEEPSNFLPFIMLHEFEAMLFVSQDSLPSVMSASTKESIEFATICNQFTSPEEINQRPGLSPSHRISNLFPSYEKVVHGIGCLQQMSLDEIKVKCPHLGKWLIFLASRNKQKVSLASL